jgi:hypothetical protein
MRALRQHVTANIPRVVALWTLAAAEEPWVLLPEHDRVDFLPTVIERIVEGVLCEAPGPSTLRPIVEAGVEHGEHRATLGVPDSVLFTEYDLLRRAIWRFLQESEFGRASTDAGRGILRIDAAISLATRASLVGYHRPQLEALGRWGTAIQTLVDESALAWEWRPA